MVQGYPGQAGIWFQGDPEVIKDYLEFNPVGIVTNTIVLDDLADTYGPTLGVIERYLQLKDDGPVVVEVDGDTAEDIVNVSAPFQALSGRIVMKIPSTTKGFRAIARMKAKGRESMVTTLFSASQAVAAVQVGATYIAPFVGPLIDSGADAQAIVRDIVQIVRGRANAPYVLGGIIRNWIAADVALRAGCDGVVVFPHTFEEMMRHAGSDEWNATFRAHWDSMVEKGALTGVVDG